MSSTQHLSDEAVAAFADGVLRGSARERAARHVGGCAECRSAVRVQREAAAVLRTAPAPALPTDLLARLRTLPMDTPLPPPPPTAIGPDGSMLLATFAPMAAFAPGAPAARPKRRGRTYFAAALLAGVAGAAVASIAATSDSEVSHHTVQPANLVRSDSSVDHHSGGPPVTVFRQGGLP